MAKFARNFFLFLAAFCLALPGASAATKKKPARKKPAAKISHVEEVAKVKATPSPTPPPKPDDLEFGEGGEIPLVARGAIAIDAFTGATLYAKNADDPQFPASTTKIMTALLVIEEGNLDKEIEVTLEDSQVGESSLSLKPGQRFTRRQALYGLMLKSANDVAHALGRDNAGSIEAFAEKMNQRALELGARATHFCNPNGLHDRLHYTTPRDLALITRAAMQQPLFRQIVATREYSWVGLTTIEPLRNHNKLLESYPGCTGVKTGFTNPAQQVLVTAALRNGREVIAVVMHSARPGVREDSAALLNYGFDHPARRTVAN